MKLNGVGKRINLASLVLDTDKEKMDLGTYLLVYNVVKW